MPAAQRKSAYPPKQGLGYRQFCLAFDGRPSLAEWDCDVDVDSRPKRSSHKGRVPVRLFVADDRGCLGVAGTGEVEEKDFARLRAPRFACGRVVGEKTVPTRRRKLAKLLESWEVIDEDDMWCMVEETQESPRSARRSYVDVAANEMGIDAWEDPYLVQTVLGKSSVASTVRAEESAGAEATTDEEEFGDLKGILEMKFSKSLRGRVEARRRHHQRAERKEKKKMRRKSGKA
ncbi:hypothetical protein FOZ62_004334 [Perkinsus olseni]|uniref:Uncharacterized protein n=1 Tax=Perkinsus olseni TaxID=32597 RepID=A0A7J6R3Z2_PEROL|nr:hypothetical protein FOZ62_004334 [Perkinsus olseni]